KVTSLEFLQAVYTDDEMPLHTRMRAAMACLPFESPKLLATAVLNEDSFAELLERRLRKLDEMKLIEGNGATPVEQSEPEPVTKPQAEPAPPSTSPPAQSSLRRLYNQKLYPRRV